MELKQPARADQATYEIAGALRHLAAAIEHLHDGERIAHTDLGPGPPTEPHVTGYAGEASGPGEKELIARRKWFWIALIGGERIHAIIGLLRAIFEKL